MKRVKAELKYAYYTYLADAHFCIPFPRAELFISSTEFIPGNQHPKNTYAVIVDLFLKMLLGCWCNDFITPWVADPEHLCKSGVQSSLDACCPTCKSIPKAGCTWSEFQQHPDEPDKIWAVGGHVGTLPPDTLWYQTQKEWSQNWWHNSGFIQSDSSSLAVGIQ